MNVLARTGWYVSSCPGEADDLSPSHDISWPYAEHVQMCALGEYPVPMVNHNLIARERVWRSGDINDASIGRGYDRRAHRCLNINAFMFSATIARRAKRPYAFVRRMISWIERTVVGDRPKFERQAQTNISARHALRWP
jgi:hypothetical protein